MNVTLPGGTMIEFVHDPLGRRIAKKVDGVIVEKYLWQGLTRLLAVYDGSDNLLMRFEYADSRLPVVMESGGATYFLTYDQVGSLRIVADSAGNVIKLINYDSFGNVISDSNPTFEIPFGFAGGLNDPHTELVRFGHRDYDPDIGRWPAKRERGLVLNMYEVARPLSSNLKGGYHISCPYGYAGRGRVRVVTRGLNLPRHGTEKARRICGFYPVRGAGQNRRP